MNLFYLIKNLITLLERLNSPFRIVYPRDGDPKKLFSTVRLHPWSVIFKDATSHTMEFFSIIFDSGASGITGRHTC